MVKNSKLGLGLALLLACSMWFYVQHVLIGYQQADAALHGIPRGNLSDLYPRWLGARELLLHHRDPYSHEVTREIQAGYYGRPLDPALPNDPKDEQGFAYPLYVVFLLAPSVNLPFSAVQAGFRWFLIVLTMATVPLWQRTLRWCTSLTTTAMLVLLVLGSFPALQGIKLQQLTLLVSGLMAVSAPLLVENHLALAGVLLAVATIKPQLVWPLAAWLLLWTFSDWRHRKNCLLGFGSTMAVLLAASEYALPGWIGRFKQAVVAYRQYTGGAESVLDVLLTPVIGRAVALLVVLGLAVLCWRLRRVPSDSPAFRFMLGLVLAVTVMILPKAAPYNQVLLIPGILLVAQYWQVFWQNRLTRLVFLISGLLVFWPWIAAVALTIASVFLPPQLVQKAWALPIYTSLAIPVAIVALLAVGSRQFAQP